MLHCSYHAALFDNFMHHTWCFGERRREHALMFERLGMRKNYALVQSTVPVQSSPVQRLFTAICFRV